MNVTRSPGIALVACLIAAGAIGLTAIDASAAQRQGNLAPIPLPAVDGKATPTAFETLSDVVSLDELLAQAVAANPKIQSALWMARMKGARIPQAASLPDPQLSTAVFLQSIQTAAGPQEVMLSLSQKLPFFGKRSLRSHVAYHDAMAAYAQASAVELEVVEQVKRAYYDLHFLQQAIAETESLEQPLLDIVEVARAQYETTKGPMQNVLQAEIELAKLKTNLAALRRGRAEAQARLAALAHLSPQSQLTAVDTLPEPQLAQTVDVLVGLSENCRPELDSHRREICRDQSAAELACREYWPDVTVGLNWYEIGESGLSPVANGRDAYSLGVGVNLPIYRQRLDAAAREARYKTAADRQAYSATLDQIQSEVRVLHASYLEHSQTLDILDREILPRAADTWQLLRESFRVGSVEFQQLIDSYRTLLAYRIDRHRRAALCRQSLASLERAVGCALANPAR